MSPRPDKRPLIEFLKVQEYWERDFVHILARAASDAEKIVLQLQAKKGVGTAIRVDQLQAVRANLMRAQADIWRKIGSSVEAGKLDAAAAGVRVNAIYTDVLLRAGYSGDQLAILLEASEAQARRTVDIALQRIQGPSYVPLSERVYNTQQLSSGIVDRRVTSMLLHGLNAREIAKGVRDLIDPNVRGGVSYAAQRLGRTELNNAFHAASVREAIKSPFIEYTRWMLSGSHPKPDECDQYARTENIKNQPPGTWLPSEVPQKPHPQCLCYTISVAISRQEFVEGFENGTYDKYIDELMRDAGYSSEWIAAGKR